MIQSKKEQLSVDRDKNEKESNGRVDEVDEHENLRSEFRI